jgi:CubicO group peptidase (beta-lactamase class C family)
MLVTRRRAIAALGAAIIAATLPTPAAAQRPSFDQLDAYIKKSLVDWGGAGLSIAIVKDDSVVFARGYGVRETGKPDPVDPGTVFAIGSNTKLFTAVAAGMLVDEGKIRWDAPITTYLPFFQLYDPWVTREITIRDMLSHRSGLGRRGDQLWYATTYDRAEILRRVRYLRPNSSFRSQYGYQNIMFLGAGEAIAAVAGKSWDDVVKERIFAPLGMTSTNTSVTDLPRLSNVASPHRYQDGRAVPVPWKNIDNVAPAGSINSSARDMAQWLRMLLADGKYGGRQLIKSETLREIQSPQTITGAPNDTLFPSTHFAAYGLGVGMRDYLGVKVLTHTGGIDGMLSQVTWVPERKLGLVILTNTEGHNNLYGAIAWRVLDAYLGAQPRDWSAIFLAQTRRGEEAQRRAEERLVAGRATNTTPSLPLDGYAGRYTNDMYGDLTISTAGGGLVFTMGTFTGDAQHWHHDTFRVTARGGPQRLFASFTIDPAGKVSRVTLDMQEGPMEFVRQEERSAGR